MTSDADADLDGQDDADAEADEADTDADADDADGCDLACDDDDPEPIESCDIWAQDCPEGEKCTLAISPLTGNWDLRICVDVIGRKDLGEPCTFVDGDVGTGRDDCRLGALCWQTEEGGVGHCVGLCQGSESNPECEAPMTACVVGGSGTLPICLPYGCDPLDPRACPGELCVPNPAVEYFACALDASGNSGDGGAPGGTCAAFLNACAAGAFCADQATYGPDCPGPTPYGCCTRWCELDDPQPNCPGTGQSCVPFELDGAGPWPYYEHLGLCTLAP